jgi:hypothetical protein
MVGNRNAVTQTNATAKSLDEGPLRFGNVGRYVDGNAVAHAHRGRALGLVRRHRPLSGLARAPGNLNRVAHAHAGDAQDAIDRLDVAFDVRA